jgi:DNA-binding transcriptional LysR family regulator
MMSEIEFRQLRYFTAVAESLSFSKAAKILHISQPPLSRQVRRLEKSVGAMLLNRSSKGVTLTPAGTLFFVESQGILRRLENSAEVARRTDRGELGNLTIGCSRYLDIMLRRFLLTPGPEALPPVQLHFESIPSAEQVGLLRQYSLDVGIVRLPIPEIDHLTLNILCREPIVAIVARTHPLASRRQISLHDLSNTPVVIWGRQSVAPRYDAIHRICDDASLRTEVIASPESVIDLLNSVRRSSKVVLAPSSMEYARLKGVTFLPIEEKHASIGIGLLHRRDDPSPILSRFLSSVRRFPGDFLYRDNQSQNNSLPGRKRSAG